MLLNQESKIIRKKSKRNRTIFTIDQISKLEKEFEKQQYMVGAQRCFLANSLNLTEAQVKVWFQNRRIKYRKENLNGLTSSAFDQIDFIKN